MVTRSLYLFAFAGIFIIGITLWAWGQPLICTCGEVKFWVGSIFDGGNSQHIADWYTLSHILHGVLVAMVGRLLFPRVGFDVWFLVAITSGIFWEVIEHTDWVLDAFRATTINQGYVGDSVLNAVADYIWMLGGFFLAWSMRIGWVIVSVLALELTAALIGRDSLTLSTIQLFFPIEAIDNWQQELNPNRQAE